MVGTDSTKEFHGKDRPFKLEHFWPSGRKFRRGGTYFRSRWMTVIFIGLRWTSLCRGASFTCAALDVFAPLPPEGNSLTSGITYTDK